MFKAPKSRYRVDQGRYCIELQMTSPHQLFDERDPAPFRERDLDEDLVDYIIGSVQELPENTPIKLVLTFPAQVESKVQPQAIVDAIHAFFENESQKASREINLLMRQGQFAMFVGVVFLGSCLSLSHTLVSKPSTFLGLAAHEGLTIMGWVAMWRPLNILLYDWWPLATRRRFYNRLIDTEVEFRFAQQAEVPATA